MNNEKVENFCFPKIIHFFLFSLRFGEVENFDVDKMKLSTSLKNFLKTVPRVFHFFFDR